MSIAKQSDFLGEAPADFGIAAIGEKFDKNGAFNLQYRKKLIQEAGNHGMTHRPGQADSGAREPRADFPGNRSRSVRSAGHVGAPPTWSWVPRVSCNLAASKQFRQACISYLQYLIGAKSIPAPISVATTGLYLPVGSAAGWASTDASRSDFRRSQTRGGD